MSGRQAVQAGFAVAGLAIGIYLQQPQLGLAVGTILGAVVANAAFPLDPIVNRQDALADIAITSAAIGQFKPIIYGSWPVGGNVVWTFPIIAIEHTETETPGGSGKGGFGGQKVVSILTTYRRHLMAALCEGPISRISRIYLDATLIYDESQPEGWTVSRGTPNGDPDTEESESPPDVIIYEKASADSLQKFVLFRGTGTQEPWAFAESLEGIEPGTIPAYRGTAVVGVTLDLGPTGRLPNLRFEVNTTAEGLGIPLHVHWLPEAATIWTIWHQGPTILHGPGSAIQYDPYSVMTMRSRLLTSTVTAALPGDRHPVASALGQTTSGVDAVMVLRQDSTMAVLSASGGLLHGEIDPRTEEEVAGEDGGEEVEAPGAGAITTRANPADGFLTTLVYTLADIDTLGQCETHAGTPETFQRLALSGTPGQVVWNGDNDTLYVVIPDDGVVDRVTGYDPLTLAESIPCGSHPTALLVSTTGTCWVTDRDGGDVYEFTTTGDRSGAIAVGLAPDALAESSDGFIWVANTGATSISRIDPDALTVETFPLPSAPSLVKGAATDGACWVLSPAARTVYLVQDDGDFESIQVPRGPSDLTVDADGRCWVVCSTARIVVRLGADATELLQPEVGNGLACVVRDINLRAGVPAEWIDVSGLDSTPVHYPIFGSASAARALEDLALAYQFIAVETGTGIKYIFKGGASIATIAESATLTTDQEGQGSLTVERAQPQELPTEVTVVYASPQRHFHTDEQTVQRPFDGPRIPVVQQLPCAFDDAQYARNLAEVLLYEPAFARYAATAQLPPIAARVEPGDLVTITTTEGQTYDVRLLKSTTGHDNRVEWDTIRHRSYLYENFQSFPAESQPGEIVIPQPAAIELHLVEAPPLPDDTEAIRLFFAISRKVSGSGGFFPAVTIYESTDNEASYQPVMVIATQAVIGTVALKTPSSPVHTWDRTTTITVVLRPGSADLTDATEEAPHYAMVGEECIGFAEVELVGLRTYELSTLRRAPRGSEQHVSTHTTNETFVLLNTAVRSRFRTLMPSAIGLTRHYKAVPSGTNIAAVTGQAHVMQGIFGKPWAPLPLAIVHDEGTGDWTITWLHRSRVQGDWVDLSDIAYDTDDLQSYQFRLYTDHRFQFLQTTRLTGAYPVAEGVRTYLYTAAEQTVDFGGPQGDLSLGIVARVPGILGYEGRISSIVTDDWRANWELEPAGEAMAVWGATWDGETLPALPVWGAVFEDYDWDAPGVEAWHADWEDEP